MKQFILSFILLFIAAGIKCQSKYPEVSWYTIYKREVINNNTGRYKSDSIDGYLTISIDLKKILIANHKSVDSFRIQRLENRILTIGDTTYVFKCTGGKEIPQLIAFHVVDPNQFDGYNAVLRIAYNDRSVDYYMKSGIFAWRK